jgi:hypothetical protein
MTELSEQLELAGVRYYRSDSDPETFIYLPGAPAPQRDPRGRPALALWVDASGARLQLGSRWELPAERLAALKRELLRSHPELSLPLLRLQPAPLGEVSAELALGDGVAEPVPVARARSSGFTPYVAVFNLMLDEAQKEQALAALHGRHGFMTLTYHGVRVGSVTATVTVSGDVAEDLAQLPADPSPEACLAQVADALEAGRLSAARSGDAGAPEALWRRAAEQALTRAAEELRRLHSGAAIPARPTMMGDTAAWLHAEVRLSAAAELPLAERADLADWFAAGEGAGHVRNMAGGAGGTPPPLDPGDSPPPAGTTSAGLAFTPSELPVAFVRLRRGAWSGALRGPAFAAVELPAHATGPLEVTTSYTSGAPYTVTLDAPGREGFALTAADLGLAEVVVDGRARRDAGAREVRLRLRYRAAGAGADDDRTVYLRRDTWEARWFLITRAPSLDGELELEWREVGANGAPTWHRPEPIDTTTITL